MKRRRSDINNNDMSPCNSNISSSLRRRTVINIPITPVRIIQDNDDSSERGVLRVQVNSPSSPSSSLSNQSNLNLMSQLSAQQIIQNMSECIKLNIAKKIDMKNAFELRMIDYMAYIMRNRLIEPLNLQMAASSLDASAKIYSFRVDRLHLDTLSWIGSLMSHERIIRNNENESSGTERNSEITAKTKRKLKNKKKKSIFTTIEALQGKVETVNYSPDMFGEINCETSDKLYLASLPQHCTQNCALNLYNDTIVDNFEDEEDDEENKIKWPPVQINFNLNINSEFSDFEFLNWSLEDEERLYHKYSQKYSLQDDNTNLVLDNNPCSSPHEVTQNHNDDYNNYSNNQSIDDDDIGIGCYANEAPILSRSSIISDLNNGHNNQIIDSEIRIGCHTNDEAPVLRQSCIISDLNNLMERIPDKNLSNSSIDKSMINVLWNGTSHWKLNKLTDKTKNVKVSVVNQKKKRKTSLINFEDEDIALGKKKVNVSKKATMKRYDQSTIENYWRKTKLLIPKISNINHSAEFKKLYYLRLDDNLFAKNDPNIIITNSDNDEVNNYNNDIDDCCSQEELVNEYQGSPQNISWENAPTLDDNSPTNLRHNRPAKKSNLAFARRSKKLDCDRLKQQLWKIFTDTDEDDDNNNLNNLNCQFLGAVNDLKNLNDSYLKLSNKLPKQEADIVSYSIAFVLTLQLANEKNLKVFSDNDNSDVFIISE